MRSKKKKNQMATAMPSRLVLLVAAMTPKMMMKMQMMIDMKMKMKPSTSMELSS